jgi:hypothetical protein
MDVAQQKEFVRKAIYRMELGGSYSPYQAIVSTGKSGLSFGNMQNDAGNNPIAKAAFEKIMNLQVQSKALTQSAGLQLIDLSENNAHALTQDQRSTISAALAAHRDIVDATDNANFEVAWGNLNGAMQAAAANPKGMGCSSPPTPFGKHHTSQSLSAVARPF